MFAIDSYSGGVAIVSLSVAASIGGLLLSRRFFSLETLRTSHEVSGYLFSIVGTLYAVLLGLVIVDSMQKFQVARDVTQQEANSLARVFMLAGELEQPDREKLQKLCVAYSNDVVNVEWPLMDDGKYSSEARRTAVHIYQGVLAVNLKTPNQQAMYQVLVQDAGDLWNSRRDRINMAQYGVPAVEWVVLLVGAVITIFFTYLFGLENRRLQTIMTGMVSGLISLNLYLLLLYGYPFSGDLCIHTNAFKVDEGIFTNNITTLPNPKLTQ